MRPAALAGGAVSVLTAEADVRMAELAMGLPLSGDHGYQGMDFTIPKRTRRAAASASRTAQVSRETRRSGDESAIWEYSCEACCVYGISVRKEKASDNNRRGARSYCVRRWWVWQDTQSRR